MLTGPLADTIFTGNGRHDAFSRDANETLLAIASPSRAYAYICDGDLYSHYGAMKRGAPTSAASRWFHFFCMLAASKMQNTSFTAGKPLATPRAMHWLTHT